MTYPTQSWSAQPPAPQQQAPRSKTPVITLAVLAVLVAVAAGMFTVFYFNAQSETDRLTSAQTTAEADLSRASDRLEQAEAKAEAAQGDLTKAKSRTSSLESERDDLATCTDAAGRYLDTKPDTPQRDEWFKKMLERCRDL
jgi:uncharacterized protein HemX